MLKNYIEKGGYKFKKKKSFFFKIFFSFKTYLKKIKIIIMSIKFLIKNKNPILENEFIAVYASRSFGHDIHFIELVSRLYFPRKISFIIIPNERINNFLLEAYSHNISFFKFSVDPVLSEWTARLIKLMFFYFEIKHTSWPKNYIVDPRHLTQILNIDEDLHTFEPIKNKKKKKFTFNTKSPLGIYRHLVNSKIGRNPSLPEHIEKDCVAKIKKKWPSFFKKPIVAIVLRRKGYLGQGINGRLRMAGPHENYTDSVKYLAKQGFNVVGTGDTLHEKFYDIKNYYDLTECGIEEDCANIFTLTNCILYVGQNSGPYQIVFSVGGRCLITDAQPLAYAPFGENDLILYKNIYIDNKKTDISKIFKYRPELSFDQITFEKDVKVKENSSLEILLSVKEMIELIKGKKTSYEIKNLSQKLRQLAPKTALSAHLKSRPPAFILKKMKKSLF